MKKNEKSCLPSLYADGYYRLYVYNGGKRITIRGKTQAECIRKALEKEKAIESGADRIDKNITVNSWAEIWIDTFIRPKVRPPGSEKAAGTMTEKSYADIICKLNRHILPEIGRLKLCEVKGVHIQAMLNTLTGTSKSTAKKVKDIAQKMFRQARLEGLLAVDPAEAVQLPRVTEGGKRAMTEEEEAAFEAACAYYPGSLWFRLLLGTGIRPGEGMALLVSDFDIDNKLLHITKAVESGTDVVSSPKTAAGVRSVPLPDSLLVPLQEYLKNKPPNSIAFPQEDGKTMKTAGSCQNEWRRFYRIMDICAGAKTTWKGKVYTIADGFAKADHGRILGSQEGEENGHALPEGLTMYCLRHTYCTNLQRAGLDVGTSKFLMGHADISTTAKIYTHSDAETAKQAGRIISAWEAQKKKN